MYRRTGTLVLFSSLALALATPALASNYTWIPGETLGDWATLANWSTDGGSTVAAALPSANDAFYYKSHFNLDLGGGSYSIKGWSASGDSGQRRTFAIKNGTLENTGDWKPYKMTMTVNDGGTFIHSAGALLPGQDSLATTYINVNNGGTFTLTGSANPLNLDITIAEGGTFNFAPSYWGMPNKACSEGVKFKNSGTLNMLSGSSFNNGAQSGGDVVVSQLGGTLNMAGTFNGKSSSTRSACSLSFEFSGGTVNAASAVTFSNIKSIAISGAPSFNVSSGAALDLSAATLASDAAVTKQGAGALALPDVPYSLTVAGTAPTFKATTTTAMGTLSVASGNTFTIPSSVTTIESLDLAGTLTLDHAVTITDAATLTGTFAIDTSAFNANDTVLTSTSETLRNKAIADAEAVGLVLTASGNDLVYGGPMTAATYYWKADASTAGDWATLSNWSTESATGADATRLPNGIDTLSGSGNYLFDLGGAERNLLAWATPSDWDNHTLTIQNGTLQFHGEVLPHSGTMTVKDGATLRFLQGSTFTPAYWSGAVMTLAVESGGALEIAGTYTPFLGVIDVASGGTATIAPTTLGACAGSDKSGNAINNAGELNLPNGLVWANGGNAGFAAAFNQTGGTLNLGGDISKNGKSNLDFTVAISGGTVNVSANATIVADTATLSGATVWNVADGAAFTGTSLTMTEASVTKQGAGQLALPDIPKSLYLQGGTVTFANETTAELDALEVASGTAFTINVKGTTIASLAGLGGTLTIAQPGLTVTAVAGGSGVSPLEGGTVVVDLANFAAGDTIIETADATLRAKVLAAAQDAATATKEVEESVNTVRVKNSSVAIFNSTTSTSMTTAANWSTSEVPDEGAKVIISGTGVTAQLDAAAAAKGWKIQVAEGATVQLATSELGETSFTFENGTSLSVASGVAITPAIANPAPSLTLEAGSTLSVADGETFALSSAITTDATSASLPTISVASGGTLTVPAGYQFKNVNLVLASGSTLTSAGGVYFGYAAADETAYFAMTATSATINAGSGRIYFGSPASGGTVVIADPIALTGVDFKSTKGFTFGSSNNATFEVAADNTAFALNDSIVIGGSSTLSLANGANINGRNTSAFSIADAGLLKIATGGYVKYFYSSGDNYLRLGGGANAERAALVLAGGSIMPCQLSGNTYRTISVTSDSYFDCYHDNIWSRQAKPFDKEVLSSVAIAEGKTLNVRNVNGGEWNGSDNKNRTYKPGKAPVTGAGNLAFANTFDGCTARFILEGGDNTATGTLSADAASQVFFANGANWAGTVVAEGTIALTNGTEAASASFGALKLASGTFPVRVWKDDAGEYSADQIDFGSGIEVVDGAIALVPQGDWTIPAGTKVKIGTASAGAAIPTKVLKSGDSAVRLSTEAGTDGKLNVYAAPASARPGMVFIVK